ncbi:predicted protein [Verticillium alfalfae VaMs.102]|uniref:Predicted protein n=1 Tax=Verticillium alfalfae (strain VaMs.102 / ATCC MYA-4576 / FGSC 10136) TaxID=526221 RepID=C9S8P2_VERA1|nr:predicted protein [Verticillium alfalfae VaMs.102]EEY14934.1 predicted protein [Verticillium alfalfae VaMs.102]
MASLRHWTPVFEDVKMEHTTVSSTVLSLLPTSLQSRLPPLRSVQKSVTMQTCQTSVTNRTSAQEPVTPTPTPRGSPKKQSRIADSPSRMSCASTLLDDEALESSPPSPPSGVHWRYALQGSLFSRWREMKSTRRCPAPKFERKAFLDGAEYILKVMLGAPQPLSSTPAHVGAPRPRPGSARMRLAPFEHTVSLAVRPCDGGVVVIVGTAPEVTAAPVGAGGGGADVHPRASGAAVRGAARAAGGAGRAGVQHITQLGECRVGARPLHWGAGGQGDRHALRYRGRQGRTGHCGGGGLDG